MSNWDTLRREFASVAGRPDGGLTAQEYAKQYGLAETTARRELNDMAALGKVTKHRCRIAGHLVNAYTIPERV